MAETLTASVEKVLDKLCQGNDFFWGDMLSENTGVASKRYAVSDGEKQIVVSVEHIGHRDMMIIKVIQQHSGQYIFIYENGEVDGSKIDDQSLATLRQATGVTKKLQEAVTCLLEDCVDGG